MNAASAQAETETKELVVITEAEVEEIVESCNFRFTSISPRVNGLHASANRIYKSAHKIDNNDVVYFSSPSKSNNGLLNE